jgi:acetyl esterase/lipase
MADERSAPLQVPAREIPVPAHLSSGAQARLAMPRPEGAGYPSLDDVQGWKRHIAGTDAMILQMFCARTPFEGEVRQLAEGGARGFELVPAGVDPADGRVYLDIHGGALIMGGGEVCKAMAMSTARMVGARVVAVDYRMPPEHPFPAGLDDCVAFYRRLLRDHDPKQIIVGGASAGGNLAAATILRARDEGLPLPAAAVLLSPEVDLTESGDTFQTNAGIDGMGSLMQANLLYANGRDLADPYLSPLFGDFAKGFPPTLLTAGTRDVFLSNAVRMHRKLRAVGVPAELHVLEAAAHGAFGGATPEEAELDVDVRLFCDRHWAVK